jgi:hypothetical protein
MGAEMTELMKIVLYLLLSLGGGVLVAILSILLLILIGVVGAWLVYTLLHPGAAKSDCDKQKGRRRRRKINPVHLTSVSRVYRLT